MSIPKLIVKVRLYCPHCGSRHIDAERNGERWDRRAHTTHRCQTCGQDFDVYASGATEWEIEEGGINDRQRDGPEAEAPA